MVWDGINDAAALSLAHVSASPGAGTDLARQNIAFSLNYKVVAVPVAMLGLVTPLIAARVMASSSIIVILNALRAGREAAA